MSNGFNLEIVIAQMAKSIHKAWKTIDEDEPKCPFSVHDLVKMTWDDREHQIPIHLVSTQFIHENDDEDDKVVKAGLRFKAKSDGFAIIEMLVDLGIFTNANAKFSRMTAPIATIEMPFPSKDDLNLPEESYHLLFTMSLLCWVADHFIGCYQDCMTEVMQQTMASHMANAIPKGSKEPSNGIIH